MIYFKFHIQHTFARVTVNKHNFKLPLLFTTISNIYIYGRNYEISQYENSEKP